MKDLLGNELCVNDRVAFSESGGTRSSYISTGKIVEIKKFNKFDKLTIEIDCTGYKFYRNNPQYNIHSTINIQSTNDKYDRVLKL